RAGGGTYERPFLALAAFGSDGLLTHSEQFDVDREAEALARFDELGTSSADDLPPASRTTRIENAATRAEGRVRDSNAAGDWARYAALFPAGLRIIDRRRMVQLEVDRDQWLASFRPIFEMTSSTSSELVATRGDRLALHRWLWMGSDSGSGP